MRLRVSKQTDEKYYYALSAGDASIVKFVGLLGIASTILVIFGYIQFLHISTLLAVIFGPVLLVTTLYFLVQYFLMSMYPGFNVARHKQRVANYWAKTKKAPSVVVFIPAAGEDVSIVEATVAAASQIDYPRYRVALLDDTKDGIYEPIARQHNAAYVHRENTGYFKKAGNMNHALEKLDGVDNILVLDADFQPRPEILRELIPYAGENVGIVQSPQHFPLDKEVHGRSKIEYGAAYIQRDFYRITQVARNRFGAAICVGTSALYNVEALKRVGGFEGVGRPKGWSHSEDVHTGLKMLNAYNDNDERYRIIYVPIQLTMGTCPDSHHSFYKQQNRWATGSMQLIFSDKTIRSSVLSLMQRVCYGSNALYYFYTIGILLSPLYLMALALHNSFISWAFTLYFIPALVVKYVLDPFLLRKELAPLSTTLVVISNAFTFLQAAFLLIIKKPLGWQATGAKAHKKSAHFTFFKLSATAGFIVLYILTLGVLIMNERIMVGPSMFVVCLFLTSFLSNIAFLFYTLIVNTDARFKFLDRKFYAALMIIVLTGITVYGSLKYHTKYDVVLSHERIVLAKQDNAAKSTDTPLDGYRRSLGDVKQMLHIR